MKKQNQETRGFVREVERLIDAGVIKSYRQLSDMTGINYTTLSIVMNGKRDLPIEHFISFEKVFKIDKSQLYNIGADLKTSENNITNHNYIRNDTPPQVANEKEVEYLKQIIKAKDETIEILKQQLKKD